MLPDKPLKVKHLFFGLKYVTTYRFLKEKKPLICGLVMHNNCNLNCLHCRITDRPACNLSFEESKSVIDSFYDEGGRTIYFEGGEPFLWRDHEYQLDDVVKYAQDKGFLATIIYTNGTYPLDTSADTVFISLDGLQKTHDLIRGKTFDMIMQNIRSSKHPSLLINFTINNYNKNEILDFCEFINGLKQIRGIFFYFHSPYYGYDELFVNKTDKKEILNRLIKNKNKYKILNSRAGLRSALRNTWKRPLTICQIYEGGKKYSCCRFSGNEDLCKDCGYLSYAEIDQVLKFKISSIRNALKYF
ncbi:MAG: radical SAM protein [Bacteroidia bacterium]|jgi:MoaA/NifB/PqqE/SkfB family radical SAM enzyme|nr:radical SAM protein [Bacteroidia bacterium]